jgi:hypothetical protein
MENLAHYACRSMREADHLRHLSQHRIPLPVKIGAAEYRSKAVK